MSNIIQVFNENASKLGGEECLRYKDKLTGRWQPMTWEEASNCVSLYGQGLIALGVNKGDSVALRSSTRYEWTLLDLAIMSTGAVTVPIYHNVNPVLVGSIIKDSGAKVIIIEDEAHLKRLESHDLHLPLIRHIILMEGESKGGGIISLGELAAMGGNTQAEFLSRVGQIRPDDIATCVYTSGTTGEPKGAEITHANIIGEVFGLLKAFDILPNDMGFSFLPLAHVVARAMQFVHIARGCKMAYAESVSLLAGNINEVRPNFMAAVPRVLEKVFERIVVEVERAGGIKKKLFVFAVGVGNEVRRVKKRGEKFKGVLKLKHWLAKTLVFKKIQGKMGGRLRYIVSGGAPLADDITRFFHAIELPVLEGYGLTETFAAITVNRIDDYHIGTVGKPLDGVRLRLAEDGEILVKGPNVFKGYRNKREATEEVFFDDGWFATGDVGEFSKEGFLRITGRKKDIIVTAGGKNIAPQLIESLLTTSPYISQALVYGDRRKYLTALLTLNMVNIKKYAMREGIDVDDTKELVGHPAVYSLIQGIVDEKNRHLASFETIKKFAVLDHEFSIMGGELTPTMKIRRHLLTERYMNILSGLYEE